MKKLITKVLLVTCLAMPTFGTVASAKSEPQKTNVVKMMRYSSDPGETDVVV